ncbi:hypothetical protein PN584_13575, partial [Parabacteroides merdae]
RRNPEQPLRLYHLEPLVHHRRRVDRVYNMKTTFMFPLLGLFVEKQMRRFRITVRLYKSELSAGSRSYGAIKKGATSV